LGGDIAGCIFLFYLFPFLLEGGRELGGRALGGVKLGEGEYWEVNIRRGGA